MNKKKMVNIVVVFFLKKHKSDQIIHNK